MRRHTRCNVNYANWNCAYPSSDGKEEAYRRAVMALCEIEDLRPTHFVEVESRLPFDVENIPTLGDYYDDMGFDRIMHPKYESGLCSTGRHLAAFGLTFRKIHPKYVVRIWNAVEELSQRITPEFATLNFAWKDSDEREQTRLLHRSAFRLFFDYYDAGTPGIGARTWFGPDLAAKIGEDLLLEAGARRTDWGGWDLVLFERPWEVSFEEFRDRHDEIEEILRRSGQFGIHEPGLPKPGPNWKPIPRSW